MRKAIFIFIAIILVAVSVDWIDACSEVTPSSSVTVSSLQRNDEIIFLTTDHILRKIELPNLKFI